MTNAACYLRSSKDRHDLSLDAQRRALHDHARDNGLAIVTEFSDAVESGSDADRPGFQQLLASLRDKQRGWDTIIALDTSRIARRRHLALIFEHEAERAGVTVVYRNIPDTDPITGMLLRSILQAMDEWHSLTSKAKGLAGMAESVRQGWRAGGQAPRGYRLEHTPTGTIRDGQPVIRSRLVLGEKYEAIAAYLQARAQGKSRGIATAISGIESSLNELEWNALTYAGHTVWNQQAERQSGKYTHGTKRRPRSEWHITRDTHPALISDSEAEAILAQLDAGQGRRNRATDRIYLLSGLLVAPDGTAFSGETTKGQAAYRLGKGRRINARALDHAVLTQIFADLSAPAVAADIAERMRALHRPADKPRDLARLKSRLATLDGKIDRLVSLIAEDIDAAPAYRRAVAQMEAERVSVADEIKEASRISQDAEVVALWTATDVAAALDALRSEIQINVDDGNIRELRTALAQLVDRVEYDLDHREAIIYYCIQTGIKMALPRGTRPAPVTWNTVVIVK
ncbi:recombinase family protein [Chromatium okenii]|jgi:DNA invertase Pin-like site-specific DNA recombinase|uniref:recombinase family protein n=1 Tax=Chromatium okenii TaxID=61644 RepID=UPI0026EF3D0E|nr:recombinase family protein [Chromatium okenii]MBV5310812.1 recombinase family protein [Chromatium okenii]